MKNKKQKILSGADIFLSEFNNLIKVFLSRDINKFNELKDELDKKAKNYKQEYEPWFEKTKAFNKQTEAYFAEDEAAEKSRHSNPFIKEIIKTFKALNVVALAMLGFDLAYSIMGWSHYGPDLILVFFWVVFIAGSTFNFWLECPLIFKRKNKRSKDFDAKKSVAAFNLYDVYNNASTAAFFVESYIRYNQLLEALSALEDDYPEAYKALNLKFKEIKDKGEFN